MNCILKTIIIAVALVTAIPLFAVTDREMEAARTLAAKHYLRYANNGSDYLDKLSPASMGELTAALKTKEKENIKAFNAVKVPGDYASWDKQKLVEYWSATFFKTPGLNEDGKRCLGLLAKQINKIEVGAAPAKAADTPERTSAGTAAGPTQEAPASTPAAAIAASEEPQAVEAEAEAAKAELDAIAQAAADAGADEEERPAKSSGTIWYVAILIVLIGVVIWLVMYASKSMKEQEASGVKIPEHDLREARKAAKEEANRMREDYAAKLAAKQDDIKQLRARVDELEAELDRTREELDRERARKAAPAPRQQAPAPQPAAAPRQEAPAAPQQASAQAAAAPKPQTKPTKLPPVVYLGYVNHRGLFVKASRSLNLVQSVYYMDIPDGVHGTFMVINDADVLDRVLADPHYWLGGGCIIENPEDADIAVEIVTMEAGQAVFADNTCRVVKKARIKFI